MRRIGRFVRMDLDCVVEKVIYTADEVRSTMCAKPYVIDIRPKMVGMGCG